MKLRRECVVLVFAPGADESFRLDAQGVGDAIDVIEEADDLRRVVNSGIIQAGRSKLLHVFLAHFGGRARELFRIDAERLINLVQGRRSPIAGDGFDKVVRFCVVHVFSDLGTEVMGVRANSIDAVVGFANNDGEHFALLP